MSSVIAAEFSSTAGRGSLLAAVFLAQSIGRLLAYGLGLGVLHGMRRSTIVSDAQQNSMLIMDKLWRLVLGLAGIPAVFAIFLRLFIPETPRFYSAVARDMAKARESVLKVGSRSPNMATDAESVNSDIEESDPRGPEPWRRRAYDYFFGRTQGWKPLLAISLQWLLLDIVFYGVGFDSPGTLAALFLSKPLDASIDYDAIEGFHVWKEDYGLPDATILQTMENNLVRTLELSSVAAVVGSLAVIPLVNYVSRKTHYVVTTAILTVLFAVTAVSISQTYGKPAHLVSMVFYALSQFFFNLGPNTLTFILAAEAFPTEFRGTCYGIAAASGKVGAIIVRPITEAAGKSQHSLVALLSAFSGVLFLMTVLAWLEPFGIGFPRVQKPRRKADGVAGWLIPSRLANLSLEQAAPWPLLDDSSSTAENEEDVHGDEGEGEGHESHGLGMGPVAGDEARGVYGHLEASPEYHMRTAAPAPELTEPQWGVER